MYAVKLVYCVLLILLGPQSSYEINLKFPHGFLLGCGSSAFQAEGTWNTSGKTESILDEISSSQYERHIIRDHSTPKVSADTYHHYKEDIKLLHDIGVDTYRFSLSWTRILPNGYADHVNQEAIKHYNDIFDQLDKYKIKPIVTIYHWDHPSSFEKFGGWLNERMAYLYSDYTRVVFEHFANRTSYFITINEPRMFCELRYRYEYFRSSKNFTINYLNEYHCMHNMLKGHALAYHLFNNIYRSKRNGKIGITTACENYYNKHDYDYVSNDVAFEFNCGLTLHPIFSKRGDYSALVKYRIRLRSRTLGLEKSRLPGFSREWVNFIRGTSDYMGVHHYSSFYTEQLPFTKMSQWPNDEGLIYSRDPKWPSTAIDRIKVVPKGLGDLLRKIKVKYNNPPVFILENGLPDRGGTEDYWKIKNMYRYMKEMLIAIKRDECNVQLYSMWSFLDSFEYDQGYTAKFGLVQVDFKSPNRTRSLKKSALWFKAMLKYRRLIPPKFFHILSNLK